MCIDSIAFLVYPFLFFTYWLTINNLQIDYTFADYILQIIKVGPETFGEGGLYEYSVFSTPEKTIMWVLTRDIAKFKNTFETEVLKYLKDNGYNCFHNRPRHNYQGGDCIYPPM